MEETSHFWLVHDQYIGGDRCILNKKKLLQSMFDAYDGRKTSPVESAYGPLWIEDEFLAKKYVVI